jgi:hypothetical protein
MRRSVSSAFAALALLLSAGAAHAGFLTSATWVTEIRPFGGPGVAIAVPVAASGASTATSVSVSLEVPAFLTSFPVTEPPLLSPSVTLNLSGTQMLTATAGVGGATIALAGGVTSRVPATTILRIPLAVGAAGVSTFTATYAFGITHYITVAHYAWTPGTVTLTGLTHNLAPLPDVVTSGSFMLDANGAGTVTLVAPTRFTVQSSLPYRRNVALTRLTLHFVPEPGAWLLLLAAAGFGWRVSKR